MRRSYKTYWRIWATSTALGLIAVGAFNVVIDPFGAYRAVELGPLKGYRPKLGDRIGKAEALRRGPWDVLVLGSSRAAVGIDAYDPAWGQAKVLNVGLAATNLYETAGIVDYAIEVCRPRKIVFLVDFLMFDRKRSCQDTFTKSRFNANRSICEYHMGNLLGTHAVTSSWDVLKDFFRSKRSRYDDRGHVMLLDEWADRTTRSYFERTLTKFLNGMYADYVYSASRVTHFRHIVETCISRDIELVVAFAPVHALQLEAIAQAGLWQDFEKCKRDLVRVVAEETSQSAGSPLAVIWDFTSYTGLNAEAVPPTEDPSEMQWYLESSHFRDTAGSLILRRIMSLPMPPVAEAQGFGVQLTPANIENHIEAIRQQRSRYDADNPREIDMVRRLAQAVSAH